VVAASAVGVLGAVAPEVEIFRVPPRRGRVF
jgi:hypothetical protein